MPGSYEDLEQADLVVLVGSNLAWCHPVLYQRLAAARAAPALRIVVIDPRRTATCDLADLHFRAARPTDVGCSTACSPICAAGRHRSRGLRRGTAGFERRCAAQQLRADPRRGGLRLP